MDTKEMKICISILVNRRGDWTEAVIFPYFPYFFTPDLQGFSATKAKHLSALNDKTS